MTQLDIYTQMNELETELRLSNAQLGSAGAKVYELQQALEASEKARVEEGQEYLKKVATYDVALTSIARKMVEQTDALDKMRKENEEYKKLLMDAAEESANWDVHCAWFESFKKRVSAALRGDMACPECGHALSAHQPMCLVFIGDGEACQCKGERP